MESKLTAQNHTKASQLVQATYWLNPLSPLSVSPSLYPSVSLLFSLSLFLRLFLAHEVCN